MIKHFNKLIASVFCLALASSHPAYASAWMSQTVHITSINARDEGFDIYIDGNQNPDNCSLSGVIRISNTVSNREDMVATALTAFTTAKPIGGFLGGCDSDGTPLAYTVWMHPN